MLKKLKEIGSEFFIENSPPDENGYFDQIQADTVQVMSGRTAIRFVLEDLARRDDIKTAYLPAYTCHTTIDPFLKAGYQVTFYDVDSAFKPMFDNRMLDRISVIFIEGYFGFVNYKEQFLAACKLAGVTIIHDATHTLFSDNGVCSQADYFVGSLKKWFGIPAGGIAACRTGKFKVKPSLADEKYTELRIHALSLKSEYMQTGDLDTKAKCMQLFSEAEERLSCIYHLQAGDDTSIRLAGHFPIQEMVRKRRENYRFLLDNLPLGLDIKPAFPDLSAGVCPLFFPVLSKRRDSIKNTLIAEKIYSPIHWPIPAAINIDQYPNAKRIYQTILSLPCDQRYDHGDLQRVGEVLTCLK